MPWGDGGCRRLTHRHTQACMHMHTQVHTHTHAQTAAHTPAHPQAPKGTGTHTHAHLGTHRHAHALTQAHKGPRTQHTRIQGPQLLLAHPSRAVPGREQLCSESVPPRCEFAHQILPAPLQVLKQRVQSGQKGTRETEGNQGEVPSPNEGQTSCSREGSLQGSAPLPRPSPVIPDR